MDHLTLVDRVVVKATGLRGGLGPLTLGQLSLAEWVGEDDHTIFAGVDLVLHLPEAATLADVTEALTVLVARHESLRTRFVIEPELRQDVAQTGELPVDVYEFDPDVYRDALDRPAWGHTRTTLSPETELEAALIARLHEAPFRITDEVLARAAVAVLDEIPVAAAMVCSHLTADLRATMVLDRQFTRLASSAASRETGPPVHQPLDQAAAEQEPRQLEKAEAALRFWEANLRWMPQSVYALPATSPPGPRVEGWLYSPAVARALPVISARTGAGTPMAMMAALAAVAALRTGTPRYGFPLVAHNRIGARLHEYVGTIAQDVLAVVDTSVPCFDDLVRQCATAIVRAARVGPCDVYRLIAIRKEIERQRGIRVHRDAVLNNVGKSRLITEGTALNDIASQVLGSLADGQSMMHWSQPSAELDILTEYRIIEFNEFTALGFWSWDTSRVPKTEIEALLRAAERLLVAAAAGDVPLGRLGELTGIQPVVRDPAEWLRLDSCWVELAAVQRLLDDALAPAPVHLQVRTGADGQPTLVAYLAASDPIRTPAQAHTACLAKLVGRPTAMTPRWYIVCGGFPGDPLSLSAWQRLHVLAEGDGR
jgi:hypothetical protein